MKNSISIIGFILFVLGIVSCNSPEEIINPSHLSRVPRATNLSISYDTSATGKYQIAINWLTESTDNLKDFEIYRSINDANFFFLSGGISGYNFVDSSFTTAADSIKLAYFVNGRGIDRFVGQSSDIVRIIVTKIF